MHGQRLLILALAAVLGLAAVFLANTYLGRSEQQTAATPGGTTKVIVARVPLEFGAPVTPDKVKLVDWPLASVPEGTFSSLPQLQPMGHTRVALRPIAANEPVLIGKLSGEGGRATLSAVLKPDMRAAAVRVGDVAGVAGFVMPGDTVDVLVTRSAGGQNGGGQQITDVLLQKVRVIAIDQDANDTSNKPVLGKTATLEVSQVDAQKLALAQQVGQLSLVLANPAADANPSVATVNIDDLRDGAFVGRGAPLANTAPQPRYVAAAPRRTVVAAPRPRAPRGEVATVQVVRGMQNSSYEVGRYVGF